MTPEKYTEAQLSAAFDLVADKECWKLPIQAVVPADADQDLIRAAVVYYTGGVAHFMPQEDGTWLVISDGYYLKMVS